MTMSISSAPISTADRTSWSLTSSGACPDGKYVATEAIFTPEPLRASTAVGIMFGYTHRAATDGMEGSVGSGRRALPARARTLPAVSLPSSVVRSIIRIARSSAQSFASFLMLRFARLAARSSTPTPSTAHTRPSRLPRCWCRLLVRSRRALARIGVVVLIGPSLYRCYPCYPSSTDGRRSDRLLPYARPRAGGRTRRAHGGRHRLLLQRCGAPAPGREAARARPGAGGYACRARGIRRCRAGTGVRLPAAPRAGGAPVGAADARRRAPRRRGMRARSGGRPGRHHRLRGSRGGGLRLPLTGAPANSRRNPRSGAVWAL